MIDWHSIAIGAIGVLATIIGWLWARNSATLVKLFEKLDQHTRDDTQKFADVLKTMNEYHIETLNRISGRWEDNSRKGD